MDKIICVGKNYLQHARELGDQVPDEPVYFFKPPSALVEIKRNAQSVQWPAGFGELHHELELVLRLGAGAKGLTFTHYSFGLDMTLREVQNRLKKAGHPWEKSKAFANSAVVGSWFPLQPEVLETEFTLHVNGVLRQRGRGRDMRWKPEELLADLKQWFTLCEGDLIFTGTPEGVGPVSDGDELELRGADVRYSLRAERG